MRKRRPRTDCPRCGKTYTYEDETRPTGLHHAVRPHGSCGRQLVWHHPGIPRVEKAELYRNGKGKVLQSGDLVRVDNVGGGTFRFQCYGRNVETGAEWLEVFGPLERRRHGQSLQYRAFRPGRVHKRRGVKTV
jgi:hypothetical protein